ncbi:MAG: hypothetical protein H0Z37_12245 [Firmicutes bacterium]|nr:hypothetical protein [Bacillota bacterium]
MKIYWLRADKEDYQTFYTPDEAEYEILREFDGRPRSASWVPIRVAVWRHEQVPEGLKPSDFPSLRSSCPVFSTRAAEGLWDLLEPNGEILPLLCDEGEYFVYNVTTLSDALDEERSEISRFPDDGQVMAVYEYVFRSDKVGQAAIFKLTQIPTLWVFVTEEFVQRVQELGLVGFDFTLVWEG